MLVVHDLVAHIDRRTVFLQRALDDLDRAHDAGAEAAGLGQNDLHQLQLAAVAVSTGIVAGTFSGEPARYRCSDVLAERLEHLGDDALGVEAGLAHTSRPANPDR